MNIFSIFIFLPMELKNFGITKKLVYSGLLTTVLPFAYAFGLLTVQVLSPEFITENYKISVSLFFAMSFFILFIAAAISNLVLYSYPKGRFLTLFVFATSFIGSLTLKTYFFKSLENLFYCDLVIALSLASIFFSAMVFTFSQFDSSLETRLALALSSICFAFGFGFFNVKTSLLCIIFSRVFFGFAAGVISKYIPCYLSLISPIEKRSIFSSLYSLGLVGGLLIFNGCLPFFKVFFNKSHFSIPLFFILYPIALLYCIPLYLKDSFEMTLYSLLAHPNESFK